MFAACKKTLCEMNMSIRIITDNDLPLNKGCVISLGNFDGVHTGHAALLKKAAECAADMGVPSVTWTFGELPQNVMNGGVKVSYITGSADKMRLLEHYGTDLVYFADFSEFRTISPETFAKDILVSRFGARRVVCGFDFRFGKDRAGTAEGLKAMLESLGCGCVILPPISTDNGMAVSATRVREYISKGDVGSASELLGRRYSFLLPVVEGRHIGRTIGFPTINQRFPAYQLVPSFGVYACLALIDGVFHPGVANIGVKPTVTDDNIVLCETHILSFNENMYNKEVRIFLFLKLRDEKRFSSLGELKAAVSDDVRRTRIYFSL